MMGKLFAADLLEYIDDTRLIRFLEFGDGAKELFHKWSGRRIAGLSLAVFGWPCKLGGCSDFLLNPLKTGGFINPGQMFWILSVFRMARLQLVLIQYPQY